MQKLSPFSISICYIKGDIVSLKEGQNRQVNILETLALWPMEQETEIKRIK